MKQAVILAVLMTVQCFSLARAQSFMCETQETLANDAGVRMETSPSTGRLEDGVDVVRQAEGLANGPEFVPRAPDHDLEVGDCESGNFTDSFNFTDCIYPAYPSGNRTYIHSVYFTDEDTITCIRVVDTYIDEEGQHLGGYPFVEKGGVGYNIVVFRFVSQEDQGMKFFIDILYQRVPGTTTEETTTEETTTEETTVEETTTDETTPEDTTTEDTTTEVTTTDETTTEDSTTVETTTGETPTSETIPTSAI